MSHVRTQIRDRVADILTGLETSGERVYKTRVHPITRESMPGLCVYCAAEKADIENSSLRATTKIVDLVIDAYAAGEDFETVADTMQAEVEKALFADIDEYNRYFNSLAINLTYSASDSKYDGDCALRYGICRAIYKVEYQTEDGNAETAL
jgi:hypothetical protein